MSTVFKCLLFGVTAAAMCLCMAVLPPEGETTFHLAAAAPPIPRRVILAFVENGFL
ncbi:MAG TPA: hypothetical protein H9772_02785 [Candidatus Oscillibacter pullicola]|nr:hypothetical protein [Candidatus Oscillibacter pullicola]